MAAYAIGYLTVHNTDWQKEYGDKMPALIQKHGGKLLARAPADPLEGDPLLPGAVVVLEFPSEDHVRAWHADPLHEPLKQLRRGGADYDLVLVNGV